MKRSLKIWFAVAIVPAILITAGAELRRARSISSEFAAEAEIRSIHAAQSEYKEQHGRYADSLRELGLAPTREGYVFALSATPDGYFVQAGPKEYSGAGRRTFFSDQTAVIRENWNNNPGSKP